MKMQSRGILQGLSVRTFLMLCMVALLIFVIIFNNARGWLMTLAPQRPAQISFVPYDHYTPLTK